MKYIQNFFSIAMLMAIRFIQTIWTLTVGIGLCFLVIIAVECVFTGKDLFKLFHR